MLQQNLGSSYPISTDLQMHTYRTHTCNQLSKLHVGQIARLSGWINSQRDHGGVLFVDLRDHYGYTQVVIYPDRGFQETIAHLPKETVIRFDGVVSARSAETINQKIATGDIELIAESYEVLGKCDPVPFSIFPEDPVPEDMRLEYRYLDLRRNAMHKNIMLRSQVISFIRSRMNELGFNEFQTPIFTSSSPEGARDYLVPSRLHPGKFYALPQSPQQFKQLLMVAGFDRYFQIAPCFRDEDARADRSPAEFYQLDLEMSFATQEDIFEVIEDVVSSVFNKFSTKKSDPIPYIQIPYREAMLKYGTDKPDLRIPLQIQDVTELFRDSGFKIFSDIINKKGFARAILVKGGAQQPKSFFDHMLEFAQSIGSQGLAYLTWTEAGIKGPIAKFLNQEKLAALETYLQAKTGDVAFFLCNDEKKVNKISGEIRVRLGHELGIVENDTFRFCWITDIPMYEYNDEFNRIDFSHNPFSMPQGGMDALMTKAPLDILAYQYDIVCNGIELSSGAIRNHSPEIMYKVFEIAGYPKSEVDKKFSGMINAFRYGAPPHGGIAPGIDRMVMLLADKPNLRDVVAFPMNQKAQDLMMKAPSEVSAKQLAELGLKIATFPS